MVSSVAFFSEDMNNIVALKRKIIRDCSNPLSIPENQFLKNFRLNKDAFMYLLEEVRDKFPKKYKTTAVPEILKVAAALTFFAEGSYQRAVGNDFNLGLAQPTASKITTEFVGIMEDHLCSKWIESRLTQEEKRSAKIFFHGRTVFPGVIGCIDGTHIAIVPPNKERQHIFRNRKGFFSINAMIVCDHNMSIRSIDARYRGANHDSLVWNLSSLKRRLLETSSNDSEVNTWLLGDGGYPLTTFLMTPFRSAISGSSEARFNHLHSRTRNIIERVIGLLKSRFRCLYVDRKLHYTPEKSTSIINACCALHNICLHFKVPDVEIVSVDILLDIPDLGADTNQTAERLRNNIMQSFQQ